MFVDVCQYLQHDNDFHLHSCFLVHFKKDIIYLSKSKQMDTKE